LVPGPALPPSERSGARAARSFLAASADRDDPQCAWPRGVIALTTSPTRCARTAAPTEDAIDRVPFCLVLRRGLRQAGRPARRRSRGPRPRPSTPARRRATDRPASPRTWRVRCPRPRPWETSQLGPSCPRPGRATIDGSGAATCYPQARLVHAAEAARSWRPSAARLAHRTFGTRRTSQSRRGVTRFEIPDVTSVRHAGFRQAPSASRASTPRRASLAYPCPATARLPLDADSKACRAEASLASGRRPVSRRVCESARPRFM
jgi:hypothetical protein